MGGAAASLAGFFVLAGGSFCGSSMTRVALSAFSGADGLTGSAGAGGTGAGFSRPAGTRGIGTGGSSSVLSTGCSGAASASHSSSHSCSFSFFLEKKERTRFFRGSSSGSSHSPVTTGGRDSGAGRSATTAGAAGAAGAGSAGRDGAGTSRRCSFSRRASSKISSMS